MRHAALIRTLPLQTYVETNLEQNLVSTIFAGEEFGLWFCAGTLATARPRCFSISLPDSGLARILL